MKNAKGIFLLLLIFVGVPFGLLALIWKDRCERTGLAVVRSPGGAWAAETTRVDCGPSMKVATEVTLHRDGEKAGESVLVLAEEQKVVVSWEGDQRLIMQLPPNAEVVKGKTVWQDVRISVIGPTR